MHVKWPLSYFSVKGQEHECINMVRTKTVSLHKRFEADWKGFDRVFMPKNLEDLS
jgi:hypothetical protein